MNFFTGESEPLHAARMFIVPITLFSCARGDEVTAESTTSRVSTTVSISAASTTRRSSACCAPTFTYSVRSSSTCGSSAATPMMASTSGNASRAWARRPPQYVERPVTRMRLECMAGCLPEPDRPAPREHVPEALLNPRADVVGHGLHQRLVLVHPLLVERDRIEEADLELGGQVAEHPEDSEVREGGRDREVEQPRQALQQPDLSEDRRRLLGPYDAD